jgi:hypothetical protein
MKKVIGIILLCSLMGACSEKKAKSETQLAQLITPDTTLKPKADIRVNKKFDDKGNLIQYDSTYSYFYSSPGFKNSISSDSVFGNFKLPLRNDYKDLLDENMNSLFFNESLFKYDFYNNDYFLKRYELNMQQFENMFRHMDSIKTDMFYRRYPEGTIKKK